MRKEHQMNGLITRQIIEVLQNLEDFSEESSDQMDEVVSEDQPQEKSFLPESSVVDELNQLDCPFGY